MHGKACKDKVGAGKTLLNVSQFHTYEFFLYINMWALVSKRC